MVIHGYVQNGVIVPHGTASLPEGAEVLITLRSGDGVPPAASNLSRQQWQDWVQSMAGSLQGDFKRPAQGDYERREPLS